MKFSFEYRNNNDSRIETSYLDFMELNEFITKKKPEIVVAFVPITGTSVTL